jgi:hypothetical protein
MIRGIIVILYGCALITGCPTILYGQNQLPGSADDRFETNTIINELNTMIDVGQLSAIYQAMTVMLQQGFSSQSVPFKRQGTVELQTTLDTWKAEVRAAKGSCATVMNGVSKLCIDLQACQNSQVRQRIQSFNANADVIKNKASECKTRVLGLGTMVQSGKYDEGSKIELTQMKDQIKNCLEQLQNARNCLKARIR